MTLRVQRVLDEPGAVDWHDVDDECVPVDHPGLLADPVAEVVAQLPAGTASERVELYVGYADGAAVANARLELPLADNPHLAGLALAVRPGHRRRGYGTALWQQLREVVRRAGRDVVSAQVGGPFGGAAPGDAFARRLGARPALEEVRRELRLAAVDEQVLDRLWAAARAAAPGYELVQWVDCVPEHLVADAAGLMARMSTDPPLGELSLEPERWDAARYREREAAAQRAGRTRVATGAVAVESGRLVAYSDIGVSRTRPQLAYQWDTIVAPAHRGHRLGTLVKVANLRLLRETVAGVQSVQTWNAAENRYMVAINEAMGFRAVERWTEYELAL